MLPTVTLRRATPSDVPLLDNWSREPHVVRATSDDPNETVAFGGVDWDEEIRSADGWATHLIAEIDGRPIGAMVIIDPEREPSRYWGDVGAGLRAIDVWIGPPDALNRGYGTAMMEQALALCFSKREVEAVLIDPLASNEAARRFYLRLGFHEVGPRRFGDDDCLVMRMTRKDYGVREPRDG